MMNRRIGMFLLGLTFVLSGCATKLAVQSREPSSVNLGSTKHLKIVEGKGRRSARETVFQQIINQSRADGYYTVDDLSEQGIEVKVAGRSVTLRGTQKPVLDTDQMGMAVNVLEWDADQSTDTHTYTDDQGRDQTETTQYTKADVVLGVTLFDQQGNAILAETEYEGEHSTDNGDTPEDAVIEIAASNAVHKLLADITPRTVTRYVKLDESDDGQASIIETAENGNLTQAIQDLNAYLDEQPNNAPAVYNLAVLVDATGDYAGAMKLYDEALKMSNKDFYSESRQACAKRLAGARALQ